MVNLTKNQFDDALRHWAGLTGRNGKHRFPYGIYPGQIETGGVRELHTKEKWELYQWNPPPGHTLPDAKASRKPTYNELVGYARIVARNQSITRMRETCEMKICRRYGEQTSKAELQFRIRAAEAGASAADKKRLAAGNAERERLRTRYQAIKTWINSLTDIDTIIALNFSDDEYWATTWTPPDST